MQLLLLLLLKTFLFVIRILPQRISLAILVALLKLFTTVSKRHKQILLENLMIAFPSETQQFRDKVMEDSYPAFARFIYDSARLTTLGKRWIQEHVQFPDRAKYEALRASQPETGILIATGHLGSFELLAHSTALYGYLLSFVVRDLAQSKIDTWWKGIRELHGNEVIPRQGAYRQIIKRLREGRDVGVLFDQNVTINRAVFVDFFSRPAATTKALALAALQVKPILIVAAIKYLGDDNYTIVWEQCNVADVYRSELSRKEKVHEITARASKIYENMIREDPASWLWMHRRWKTTPEGIKPPDYNNP